MTRKQYRLLHLPTTRDIVVNRDFTTIKAADKFLNENAIYFLTPQDSFIIYELSKLAMIKSSVEAFISASSGYPIQRCEIDIVVKS